MNDKLSVFNFVRLQRLLLPLTILHIRIYSLCRCCTDCKAVGGKFVISGLINKTDLTVKRLTCSVFLFANHFSFLSLQGRKGLCQAPLVPLVPQAHRGHRASLESPVFQEALAWGLQDPLDLLGHRDRRALKVQQV